MKKQIKITEQNALFTVLLLYDRSWSEVEWILPVLYMLKKKANLYFLAILSDHWLDFNKEKGGNLTLSEEFSKITNEIKFYSKNQISIKRPDKIRLILCTFQNSPFKNYIINSFPQAKVIRHPQGNELGFLQNFNHPRNFNNWDDLTPDHDLMLNTIESAAHLRFAEYYDAKIAIVGAPRFDSWWTKKLCQRLDFLKSHEVTQSKKTNKVFLFVDSGPKRELPGYEYEYVFLSVVSTVLSYKDSILLIKPHPRQSLLFYQKLLIKYDSSRWYISSFTVLQLASISNMIISVTSSTISDSLALNKPVIEFNPFVAPTEAFNINQNGRIQSKYSLLGMSVHVRTKEDFYTWVEDFFNNKSKHVWENQQIAFRKYFPKDDNASQRAANIILNYLSTDRTDIKDRPKIYRGYSPITSQNSFFLNGKNLKLRIMRIQGISTPINFNIIKEFRDFFDCDTFIATGLFNPHLAKAASVIFNEVYFIESKSDLYQPYSFNCLKNCKNFQIINSSDIIKCILHNAKGKALFWLSSHDGDNHAFTLKTNAAIIKEIEAIKYSNIQDPVILINNMKFFQHLKTNNNKSNTSAKNAYEEILKINQNYQFAVLGDIAIAYMPNQCVFQSEAVKKITLSQLYMGYEDAFEADNYITFKLKGMEREVIKTLCNDYFSHEVKSTGGLYNYWNGLINYGDREYNTAKYNFFDAISNGYNSINVYWLLAISAFYGNDNDLAIKQLKFIMDNAPDFKHANQLYSRIRTNYLKL